MIDRQLHSYEQTERILFLTSRLPLVGERDMTPTSISEVTAKRTSLLVRVASTCDHSVPRQPVRKREREAEGGTARREVSEVSWPRLGGDRQRVCDDVTGE